ncbi:MAG: hypothetical protein N3D73_03100, partial [Candidatus Diapherotrites archaeon]|nr:hypothetical protein [Candidatus Diapherotrites archaeon]
IILASFVILSSATIRQYAGIKIVRKMSIMVLAIIVIFSGIIFILYQEMQSSYLSKESPRGILLKTGIKVAKDFFPLGSGFGTYSSGINQRFYSPLFYKYRLHRVWGLSEEKRSFTNDTFWPHVLAETGIFGLLSYFSIIVIFLVKCFKGLRDFKNERVMWIATLSLLLLVLSLVEVTKATFYEMSLWTFFYFGSIGVLTAWFQSLN